MNPAVTQIDLHTYLHLCGVARHCGLRADALLDHAGLHVDPQQRKAQKLPFSAVTKLFDYGRCHAPEQRFAVALAESFSFDFFPAAETFLATSSDLREASQLLTWVPDLLLSELRFDLQMNGPQPHLRIGLEADDTDPGIAHAIETCVACCIIRIIHKLGVPLQTIELRCRHTADNALASFAQQMDFALRFDCPHTQLCAPSALWSHPILATHTPIHSQTALLIEDTVQRLQQRNRVTDQVKRQLSQAPLTPLAAVATRLDLTPRGLQRRLQSEGSSFQAIQDAALKDLAQHHLRNAHLDMESIAIKLGFSDRHSFTRAYRRLTGTTPSHYRKGLTSCAHPSADS